MKFRNEKFVLTGFLKGEVINMCVACEIENGDRTEILDNSATDYKVYIENVANIFRMHMTDGRHHTTRDIYHCPFCGRQLINK